MRTHAGLASATVTIACVVNAFAQSGMGAVDTRQDVEEQIRKLEQMVGGDVAAEKQAVALRWLADLYVSVGKPDEAEASYQRILVFFPGDVATSNDYAVFLLEQRNEPERAEHVLDDAIQWARAAETPPPYLGRTHALHARVLRALGQPERALAAADRAVELLDEDAAEEALRVRAHCLVDLGRRDDARAAYLSLIGATGGANPDDASDLVALLSASAKIDAETFRKTVAGAIADARRARAEAAKQEGAAIVELAGEGNVRLEATLRRAKGPAAILFVPDAGGRRAVFTPYAQLIALDGITTLTLDPRGHGDSRCDSLPSYDGMPDYQRERLGADVVTACRFLQEKIGAADDRVAIVAEGRACAIVERALHDYGLARAVVYLSPVFDPDDRDLTSALSFHPPRPMLAVASDEDVFAVRSLALLADAGTSGQDDQPDTRVFRFAGHGVQLLRDPANFATISSWITRSLGAGD